MEEKECLLIITFEDCNMTIRTKDPQKECMKAFQRGKVISIIQDSKIIYSKSGLS